MVNGIKNGNGKTNGSLIKIPKEWVRTIISIVVILSGVIFSHITFRTKCEAHVKNKDVHMTYQEKSREFIPRKELDVRLQAIEDDIADIKKAVMK